MRHILTKGFNLRDTLESGQFFRFTCEKEEYYIQHKNKVFKLRQEDNKLFYSGADRRFVSDFLGLKHDIDKISSVFDEDVLASMRNYPGIRIMKQDPWECTIAFLLSSASNIPRIKKNLDSLARRFGKRILSDGKEFFTIPLPYELGSEKEIKECGAGFRAKYLAEIGRKDEAFFWDLKSKDYNTAKKMLTKLLGIGDKIADCILLFSYGHLNTFPVDVWIKRVMEKIYFKGKSIKNEEIIRFAQDRFYPYAGYAQQFLYHDIRNRGR